MNFYLQWFFETGDIWLEELTVHEDAQNWKLHLHLDGLAFENMHRRGFYLGADEVNPQFRHGWLELSRKKIKWTARAQVSDDNNSENWTIMPLWV